VIGKAVDVLNKYVNKFNIAIGDPPFGIGYDRSYYKNTNTDYILYDDIFEDYEEFTFEWINETYSALKSDGCLYLISGWSNIKDVLNAVDRTDFIIKNHIIWYFDWGLPTFTKYITSHYHVLFLIKDEKHYTFNPYTVSINEDKPYEKDVWYWGSYNRGNDPDRIDGHPCQLPIIMLKHILRISSNPNEWVADIFSGSGGTLLASRLLGRNCVSIEKNGDYLDIIKKKAMIEQKIVYSPDLDKKNLNYKIRGVRR